MSKMAIKSKNSCAICSIKNVTFYKLDDEVLGKNVALLMASVCEAEVANIGATASAAQFCQSCVLAVIQAESVIAKVRSIFQAAKATKKVAAQPAAAPTAAVSASPKVAKKSNPVTAPSTPPVKTNGVAVAVDAEPAAMQQLVKGKYVFQCEHCEWRTTVPKLYINHLQWKHEVETKRIYGCTHCKESYMHLHFLIGHMAKKHGVGEPVDGATLEEEADDTRAGAKTPEPKKPPKRPVEPVANGEVAATKKPKLSETVAEKKTPKKAAAIATSTPLSVFKKTGDESASSEKPKKPTAEEAQLKKAALFKKTGDEVASLEANNQSAVKKAKPFSYVCMECDFKTTLPKRLAAHHVASHDATNMRIFKCPHCKEVYQRAGALQNHINVQHGDGEKPAKKASESKSKAEKSEKSTESPKKAAAASEKSTESPKKAAAKPAPAASEEDAKYVYQCTECDYTATSVKLFKKHRETKHQAVEDKIFQCRFCPEAFKRGISLQKHMQKHEGQVAEAVEEEKPATKKKPATPKKAKTPQADTTAVKFPKFTDEPTTVIESDADDVTIVEEASSAKKQLFDCLSCPYVTHSKKKFAKHMAQSHGGGVQAAATAEETTFVPMMNSTAAPKRKLSVDESDSSKRPASKVKRVACNQCDKTFKTVAKLHTHIESDHMGGDVYTCPYCAKAYKSRPKYEEHIFKEACRNKKHLCSVIGCGKRFVTEKDLAYHTATRHLEESMRVIDYEEEQDDSGEDDE